LILQRAWTGWAAVGWLGLVAALEGWVSGRRPEAPDRRAGAVLLVASGRDSGPGSLRDAITAAIRGDVRARIDMRVRQVVLETPLPPLVGPHGIVLECTNRDCEIDATALGEGSVLDVGSPATIITGVHIRGAAGQGVLVRASDVRLEDLELRDCGDGVFIADGQQDVVIERSSFVANTTGVRLPATSGRVAVRANAFARHGRAGVWAVSASAPLPGAAAPAVSGNTFTDDRMSVVAINVPARVEDNRFLRPVEAGIYLTGAVIVRRNGIHGGAAFGIYADAADGAVIEDNETGENVAVGILLREARNTVVQRNHVYRNGYGIATVLGETARPTVVSENIVTSQRFDGVYVIGGSPVLRANRALGNASAAVRVLDLVSVQGVRTVSDPVLEDNVLRGNAFDAVVRGVYRVPPEPQASR
jgi:hypothetical protein